MLFTCFCSLTVSASWTLSWRPAHGPARCLYLNSDVGWRLRSNRWCGHRRRDLNNCRSRRMVRCRHQLRLLHHFADWRAWLRRIGWYRSYTRLMHGTHTNEPSYCVHCAGHCSRPLRRPPKNVVHQVKSTLRDWSAFNNSLIDLPINVGLGNPGVVFRPMQGEILRSHPIPAFIILRPRSAAGMQALEVFLSATKPFRIKLRC